MEVYGLIHRFALSRGSHRDAAPGIIQEVLRSVAKAMQGFEYDPSKGTFRGWLFTAIRREIGRSGDRESSQEGKTVSGQCQHNVPKSITRSVPR
ncbi:hypothetical protein N8652_03200 [bacterium]|nr:hypothetical protein [bacterium]